MHTENFTIDDCSKDQEIKYLAAGFPNRSVSILQLAFFIKAVNLSDLTGLVITSYKSDLVRVP